MENPKFIVALFKRDSIQLAFKCNKNKEVDELISNTLSNKDDYMYYDDEIIKNFKKDDEDYDDEFYTGEGWYSSNSKEIVWVNGQDTAFNYDNYKIRVFENDEVDWFLEKYPDVFLHIFNNNRFDI
ncbi:MAG: hypothetical protein GXX85_14135 [Ignavibacteria bacterium]|nr:hypothetical protein [Ignavibacteria bacterium]